MLLFKFPSVLEGIVQKCLSSTHRKYNVLLRDPKYLEIAQFLLVCFLLFSVFALENVWFWAGNLDE